MPSTTTTLHLQHGKLTLYSGGFDAYLRARTRGGAAARSAGQAAEPERQKLQAFVDRFRAQGVKARQAQSRLKALARLEPIVLPAEEAPARICVSGAAAAQPAPDRARSRRRSAMRRASRYCRGSICGSTPTTGSRCSAPTATARPPWRGCSPGALAPMAGQVTRSPKLAVRLFRPAPDRGDAAASDSAFDHLVGADAATRRPRRCAPGSAGSASARTRPLCRSRSLSGGERARLNLALVTHDAPALLILDEPTNHLDIEAREALVQALNDFPGAVVLVSHDWHLVELVADRLWLVADGTVRPFDGDLEDYERQVLDGRRGGERAPPGRAEAQQPARRAAARGGAAERARAAAANARARPRRRSPG